MASPEGGPKPGLKEKIWPLTKVGIGLAILVESFPINSIVRFLGVVVGGAFTYSGGKGLVTANKT